MAPANALSCCDFIDTSLDSVNASIVSEPVVINALDLTLAHHIKSSLSSDPLVLRALSNLADGSPLFPHSALKDWVFNNGHLYFRGCMYVPPTAQSSLLHSIHDSPLTGHLSHFHTKAVVKRDFWWPGLSVFVSKFVAGCAVCQQNKVNTHLTSPPLVPIPSSTTLPFKQLFVDLIMDLPTSNGLDSLMVVVDHGLTKGVILAPCSKMINANRVAQLFFNFVFKHFGLYDSIISDRGPQFASAFARELACILKYDVHLSTAYHPQTDGKTERTNQEIGTYLWIFCTHNPRKWAQFLTSAEFSITLSPTVQPKPPPFPFSLDMNLELIHHSKRPSSQL